MLCLESCWGWGKTICQSSVCCSETISDFLEVAPVCTGLLGALRSPCATEGHWTAAPYSSALFALMVISYKNLCFLHPQIIWMSCSCPKLPGSKMMCPMVPAGCWHEEGPLTLQSPQKEESAGVEMEPPQVGEDEAEGFGQASLCGATDPVIPCK